MMECHESDRENLFVGVGFLNRMHGRTNGGRIIRPNLDIPRYTVGVTCLDRSEEALREAFEVQFSCFLVAKFFMRGILACNV